MFLKRKLIAFTGLLFFAVSAFAGITEDKILALVESGTESQIEKFLSKHPNLSKKAFGADGDSLLMVAVQHGRGIDIISSLLRAGVDPKAKNKNGDTAVTYAAKFRSGQDVIKKLVTYDTLLPFQRKNRVLRQNANGQSALDIARESQADEEAAALEEFCTEKEEAKEGTIEEPEEEASAPEPEKPAEEAIRQPEPEPVAEEAAPTPPPEEVAEPLIPVTADLSLALQEAAKAAEKNATSPYKRVYLFEGIEAFDTYQKGKTSGEDLPLIEDPDMRGKNGRTLLHKAAAEDDYKTIKALVASNATIDLTDDDGWTALMYAARFAKKEATIATLLSAGADASAKNRYGTSVLEIAASYNKNPEIVASLMQKASDADKQKAFISAVGLGRDKKIVQKFLAGGTGVNMPYKGKTPLMYAAETNSNTDIIKLLLEKGADKKMLTSDYKDAYYFASQNPSLPHNSVYWSLNNSKNEKGIQ